MKAQQDLVAGAFFLFLGIAVVLLAQGYPPGAAMIPLGVGSLMALLGAVLGVRTLLRWRAGRVRNVLVDDWPRFLLPLGGCLVFALLVGRLGFYTTSAMLVLAMPLLLGFRRPGYIAAAAVLFLALLVAVFALLLNRRLPAEFFL